MPRRTNASNPNRASGYKYDKLRQSIKKRDDYQCVNCGRSEHDGFALEVDHITPWYMGGEDVPDNLETLCRDICHKAKTSRDEKERRQNIKDGINESPWSRQWF